MRLLPVFRKPLRASSRKLLNLYGEIRTLQVFRKQVFLDHRHLFLRARLWWNETGHAVVNGELAVDFAGMLDQAKG